MNRKGFAPLILIFIVVGLLAIGGGIWYYRSRTRTTSILGNQQSPASLTSPTPTSSSEPYQASSTTLSTVSTTQSGKTNNGCPGYLDNGACKLNSFKLTTPIGGEKLCFGKDFTIRWKNPPDMKFVNLFIEEGDNASIKLGTFPANFNETGEKGYGEYVWEVGGTKDFSYSQGYRLLREGYTYELIINSTYQGWLVSDTSKDVFSILNCNG